MTSCQSITLLPTRTKKEKEAKYDTFLHLVLYSCLMVFTVQQIFCKVLGTLLENISFTKNIYKKVTIGLTIRDAP